MSPVWLVASGQLRQFWRNRSAMVAALICLLLSVAAALSSLQSTSQSEALRLRLQGAANASFNAQPDRHPHRVVHYGHFVFRPVAPLAAFDPGVESWTGRGLYMEGHRQNSANFSDARQSSLLLRFGQLSPAYVLQILLPLLLIFIGHACITGEREQGTLQQQLLLGVGRARLLSGKALGLFIAGAALAVPAWAQLFWIGSQHPGHWPACLLLAGSYLLWIALWSTLIVAGSARSGSNRTALLALLSLWCITAIVLPRLGSQIALNHPPLPSRAATEIGIDADLRTMGDSHDPNDPHFATFRQQVLQRHGVTRVEDLPVNFRGLLAVEGERLSASLFDRYAAQRFATENAQADTAMRVALGNPAALLTRLSSRLAGTDLAGWHDFLLQAERHRFELVQRLNQLQADAVHATDDAAKSDDVGADQRSRIDAAHWRAMPEFQYATPATDFRSAWLALTGLATWLTLASLLLFRSSRL
jgi:ABC-2 type transport system permease protein